MSPQDGGVYIWEQDTYTQKKIRQPFWFTANHIKVRIYTGASQGKDNHARQLLYMRKATLSFYSCVHMYYMCSSLVSHKIAPCACVWTKDVSVFKADWIPIYVSFWLTVNSK